MSNFILNLVQRSVGLAPMMALPLLVRPAFTPNVSTARMGTSTSEMEPVDAIAPEMEMPGASLLPAERLGPRPQAQSPLPQLIVDTQAQGHWDDEPAMAIPQLVRDQTPRPVQQPPVAPAVEEASAFELEPVLGTERTSQHSTVQVVAEPPMPSAPTRVLPQMDERSGVEKVAKAQPEISAPGNIPASRPPAQSPLVESTIMPEIRSMAAPAASQPHLPERGAEGESAAPTLGDTPVLAQPASLPLRPLAQPPLTEPAMRLQPARDTFVKPETGPIATPATSQPHLSERVLRGELAALALGDTPVSVQPAGLPPRPLAQASSIQVPEVSGAFTRLEPTSVVAPAAPMGTRVVSEREVLAKVRPLAPQTTIIRPPLVNPSPVQPPSLPARMESTVKRSEPRPVHVRISTIEVRVTTPPPVLPETPPSGMLQGFDDYALIRSYVNW